jgi:copper oxidase (laccase) domain-containing protein
MASDVLSPTAPIRAEVIHVQTKPSMPTTSQSASSSSSRTTMPPSGVGSWYRYGFFTRRNGYTTSINDTHQPYLASMNVALNKKDDGALRNRQLAIDTLMSLYPSSTSTAATPPVAPETTTSKNTTGDDTKGTTATATSSDTPTKTSSNAEQATSTTTTGAAVAGFKISVPLLVPTHAHGSTVIRATSLTQTINHVSNPCDGVVTNVPGLWLGVMTADCVPLLFIDHRARIIGIAHVGWKGASLGIVHNMIHTMCTHDTANDNDMDNTGSGEKKNVTNVKSCSNVSDIEVMIGPHLTRDNYEVDLEFRDTWNKLNDPFIASLAHSIFTPAAPVAPSPSPSSSSSSSPSDIAVTVPKLLLDMTLLIYRLLQHEGIVNDHIHILSSSQLDTLSNDHLWYSYRRATKRKEPIFGCHFSLINIM